MTTTMPVNAITIGKRHRKDYGDLAGLAASINDTGLVTPITVQPGGLLIAGERRLRAWQMSRFAGQDIPVYVMDLEDVLSGEYAENAERKDFTPSEAVNIMRALTPIAKAQAKERQLMGLKRGDKSPRPANLAEREKGRAREQVAKMIGRSHGGLSHAFQIVAAAEADAKKYGHLVEEMDRTGRITTVYRKLAALQGRRTYTQSKAPARPSMEPHPSFCKEPSGLYSVIVVDGAVPDLAARLKPFVAAPAVMWVWANDDLPATDRLLSEFGFVMQRVLVWQGTTKRNSDVCLIAANGAYPLFRSGPLLHLSAPRGRWQRPIEFIALVEKHCRADRFLQCGGENPARTGWDYLNLSEKVRAA
jgi:ParB-like chromosome segregation protein Spo0J